ncbi:MAG: hypothetical protein AB2686_03345, partial [Candidatus Thiodiazotropha sp.]
MSPQMNANERKCLRQMFIVPTPKRGNTDVGLLAGRGMGSHGGPWEPDKNMSPQMNANERKCLKVNVGCGLPHRSGLDLSQNPTSSYPNSHLETQNQFAFIHVHLRTDFSLSHTGVEQ